MSDKVLTVTDAQYREGYRVYHHDLLDRVRTRPYERLPIAVPRGQVAVRDPKP